MPTTFPLIQIAFLMLAAGACGGLLFTGLRLLRVPYPRWLGAAHGLLGLAALATLGLALAQAPSEAPLTQAWWALGVFTAALLGGLMFFRWRRRPNQSLVMALMHGSLALVGLYLLYPAAFAAAPL